MSTRKFTVYFACEVTLDDHMLAAVLTDEWRERFYGFHDAKDVAAHLAFNLAQGTSLKQLDGFADQPLSAAVVTDFDISDVTECEDT